MKYKKKRKNNTVIPYYVDNDNEILFNLAIDSCVPLNKFHATYFPEVGGHQQHETFVDV
jgi:hypothetical protein